MARQISIFKAIVYDNEDPTKTGRVRLIIPEFTGEDSITGWVNVVYPGGSKSSICKRDIVDVLVVPGIPGEYHLTAYSKIYTEPENVGSTAPGARDDLPVELSAKAYAESYLFELDPEKEGIWILKIKGQDSMIYVNPSDGKIILQGGNSSMELDAASNQITFNPGDNDIIIETLGGRVAMVGDPVIVQTKDGPAKGLISKGSVRMQGRKVGA